jgi:hypothetical protein
MGDLCGRSIFANYQYISSQQGVFFVMSLIALDFRAVERQDCFAPFAEPPFNAG